MENLTREELLRIIQHLEDGIQHSIKVHGNAQHCRNRMKRVKELRAYLKQEVSEIQS